MNATSDSGVQLRVIAEYLSTAIPILTIVLVFSLAYPIQNWPLPALVWVEI
jgi:hypothetical protein